jgi:hypothetical protein
MLEKGMEGWGKRRMVARQVYSYLSTDRYPEVKVRHDNFLTCTFYEQ